MKSKRKACITAILLAIQAVASIGFFAYGLYQQAEAEKYKTKLEACEATQ